MFNNIKRKSCEQELITKKYIATHTNYFLKFKSALYPQCLSNETLLFNSSRKLFKLKFLGED